MTLENTYYTHTCAKLLRALRDLGSRHETAAAKSSAKRVVLISYKTVTTESGGGSGSRITSLRLSPTPDAKG